jgi:hypothetical protein
MLDERDVHSRAREQRRRQGRAISQEHDFPLSVLRPGTLQRQRKGVGSAHAVASVSKHSTVPDQRFPSP